MQTTMDVHEIMRTQVENVEVAEDRWNYFSFYNNGNTGNLRVYISTNVYARIEA